MLPVITCALALTLLYALLMGLYTLGWQRQRRYLIPATTTPVTSVSIIIPARNEEVNVASCIRAILAQDYPPHLVEIIVADDHSDDHTAAIAKSFGERVRVILMKDDSGELRYKKGALAAGIRQSSGELIVTTDADCVAPPGWLQSIAAFYEKERPVMIAGPVAFNDGRSLLAHFQSLDFMSMQGITAAAHALHLGDMANGANLAFTREAYEAVGGYSGIDGLASGDDFLLLHKMRRRFPGRVSYLKAPAAIVQTAPQSSWSAFLQQRIRWASKSGKYPDWRLTVILALVYFFNCAILVIIAISFRNPLLWPFSASMMAIKWLSEFIFLLPVARFYNKRKNLLWLLPLQPLHIVYIIVAGFLGMIGSYRWKGRKLR